MKVIVGLGNPGGKYEKTRHNVGFMVIDRLVGESKLSSSKKFEAEICESGGILLVKPTTFMNESGRSVRKVMDFYKLDLSDLWVVHDDLDIPLRKYKIVKGVGPRGHKGVLSVENHVGKSFWRVRVGVENRKDRSLSGEDYTLMNFGKEEREVIDRVLEEIVGGL